MNCGTIAIHWHDDNHPVYAVDFQPCHSGQSKLATAGGDNNVRIWLIHLSQDRSPTDTSVEYLSTLRKHTQAVNAIKFDPKGEILASAGDDGLLVLWELSDNIVHEFGAQDDDLKESWITKQVFNTNSEIYDISWSPDSRYIATGSMDNRLKIYDVATGQKVAEVLDHSHYVQGVAWDPLNRFLATQSADRSVLVYELNPCGESPKTIIEPSIHAKINRFDLLPYKLSLRKQLSDDLTEECQLKSEFNLRHENDSIKNNQNPEAPSEEKTRNPSVGNIKRSKRASHLFHSETLQSFFRRLAFSPDGSLLVTPSGTFRNEGCNGTENKEPSDVAFLNTVYIFSRGGLKQAPVCHLPGLSKPAIAVAFSPIKYNLSMKKPPVFSLPYKMVFAVATHDSIIVYDTESLEPLGLSSNLHYLTITDLCWDCEGSTIIVSSAEGFCSIITFDQNAFGVPFTTSLMRDPTKTTTISTFGIVDITTESQRTDKPTIDTLLNDKAQDSMQVTNFDTKNEAIKSTQESTEFKKAISQQIPTNREVDHDSKESNVLQANESAPSLISQFVARPITADEASLGMSKPRSENRDENSQQKKRRITPILIAEK